MTKNSDASKQYNFKTRPNHKSTLLKGFMTKSDFCSENQTLEKYSAQLIRYPQNSVCKRMIRLQRRQMILQRAISISQMVKLSQGQRMLKLSFIQVHKKLCKLWMRLIKLKKKMQIKKITNLSRKSRRIWTYLNKNPFSRRRLIEKMQE